MPDTSGGFDLGTRADTSGGITWLPEPIRLEKVDLAAGANMSRGVDLAIGTDTSGRVDLVTGADKSGLVDLADGADTSRWVTWPPEPICLEGSSGRRSRFVWTGQLGLQSRYVWMG